MAVSPSLKLASIAIGAGGVITGGAVGIHNYLSKSSEEGKKEDNAPTQETTTLGQITSTVQKSIAQSLSTGKQLLTAEKEDAKWNENWGTFKTAYDKDHASNTPWTFSNWSDLKQKGDNTPAEFKQRCKDNSAKPVADNDKLLKEVEKYCTKDI